MTDESWRAGLKVHPAAELLPMMNDAELDELAADIAKHGLRYPVVMTAKGGLLDGRNRLAAICRIKDPECRKRLMRDVSQSKSTAVHWLPWVPEDPVSYVLSANLHRRHLTPEQKREVIARVLKAQPEQSDRAIAKQTKNSPTTVGKVRQELEEAGDVSTLDTRPDSKGRQQPARKTPPPKTPSQHTLAQREQRRLLDEHIARRPALLCPACAPELAKLRPLIDGLKAEGKKTGAVAVLAAQLEQLVDGWTHDPEPRQGIEAERA